MRSEGGVLLDVVTAALGGKEDLVGGVARVRSRGQRARGTAPDADRKRGTADDRELLRPAGEATPLADPDAQ